MCSNATDHGSSSAAEPVARGTAPGHRRRRPQYRLAWYVIAGSIPIGIVGLAADDVISAPLRSLWVVAVALIAWSAVMYAAERVASQPRAETDLRLPDALLVGLVQCIALIPGVSRSGATISAGLFRGLDRVTATRLSFFLSIPALVAAGARTGPQRGRGDLQHGGLDRHRSGHPALPETHLHVGGGSGIAPAARHLPSRTGLPAAVSVRGCRRSGERFGTAQRPKAVVS